jgi:hypothetical protein
LNTTKVNRWLIVGASNSEEKNMRKVSKKVAAKLNVTYGVKPEIAIPMLTHITGQCQVFLGRHSDALQRHITSAVCID